MRRIPGYPLSRFNRIILIIAGSCALALGIVGVVVPILPTTPFILLSAACFARSSKTLYRRLLTTPLFGRIIRRYLAGHGISIRTKLISQAFVAVTIGFSALAIIPANLLWVRIVLILIGIAVIIHIGRL